jgi:polyphosphate kinase
VRDEPDGLRRYAHIGTGNYNPKTARLYEDIGLITADPQVGADLGDLFNQLSGYSRGTSYERLLTAPDDLRDGIVERIQDEVEHRRSGRSARIRMKINSLVDEVIIDELYRASQAGVPVDLLIRGICALKPGVPGLSETIRVRSILGRFLEHSRVLLFDGGGDPEVWIGSADLMHRNLDRRVEALVRISAPENQEQLINLLDLAFSDGTAAWHLDADGHWTRHERDADGQPLLDLQEHLVAATRRRRRASRP